MLNFEVEQKVVQIGKNNIGGNPGQNPITMIGSVFYAKHAALLNEKTGEIDKSIVEKELNDFTGFVLKDEVMEMIIDKKGDEPLKSISRPIKIVNEEMPIIRLFYKLIDLKAHIAMVVDEYGMVSGLVTMEDVFETLIGLEIVDEMDNVEDMQLLARKNWEERARKLGLIK